MAKLRRGSAELRLETGRWIGLEREDRICAQCGLREVENVEQFVLRCDGLVRESNGSADEKNGRRDSWI